MLTVEKLQIWGLTNNQAKLLYFFIKNRDKSELSYKKIKDEIKAKQSFYREVLQDLIEKKFIYEVKKNRPITYQFNEDRFREILQEKKNSYLKKQQEFNTLLEELKEGIQGKDKTQFLLNFFKSGQAKLKLTDDQISILIALLSNENRKNDEGSPLNAMTLKEFSQELNKNNTIPVIRYNLSSLEKRGFVTLQKIGRTNYYIAKDLKSIIEIEQNFQETIWEEKEKRMQEIIQFLQRKPQKLIEKEKDFEVINNFEDIKNNIIKLIKEAESEILLDFRCDFERIDPIRDFLSEIFNILLETMRKKENLNIKLLLNVDDWLIHNLNIIFSQFIQVISAEKFGFRVPIERAKREFRILIDEKTLFQIVGIYELTIGGNGLEINNEITVGQAKLEFDQIWENSLDFRDAIIDYTISKDLEKAIRESNKKYPPEYKFTNKFIVLTGLKKVLRFLLRLYKDAKNELLTITGPIFPSKAGYLSVIETLSKEKFYDKLNAVIEDRNKAGVNIKWIRNTTGPPHLSLQSNDKSKKDFMDFILNMSNFQMRQISLEQYQFSIIDHKILCIFDYSEQKLTLNFEDFIIEKYIFIFQKAWSEAYDIRLQWLTEVSETLQKYVQESFYKIDLQISMPKEGEIKKYEGKYLKPILGYLFKNTKTEIYILHTFSLLSTQNQNEFFLNLIYHISDYFKIIKDSNIQMKIILTYLPELLNEISSKYLETYLDLFPRYQINFLPSRFQSNNLFGIFDNYLFTILGGTDSDKFYLIITNDNNLRNYYREQFSLFWKESVDFRQIFYEYSSSPEGKKIMLVSFNKYNLEKEVESDQIKQLFPPF